VQNLDDAKFCRACGADIRLVPQALQGGLPVELENRGRSRATRHKEKKHAPPTIDAGLKKIFEGFGLFIIFLIGLFVFRGAFWLTVWFIIPALASVGEGIGQLIRARHEPSPLTSQSSAEAENFPPAPFAPVARELSSPDTREIVHVPTSVTEVTTRHLNAPSKTH
jgi:hypothetical protein